MPSSGEVPGKVFNPEAVDENELLSWLQGTRITVNQLEQFVKRTVVHLRDRDVTWEHIGQTLGMSPDAAKLKYS